MIRTLIVDDEPLAREGIRIRLQEEPGFEIVGEAVDGPSAIQAIEQLVPDLVFLDVEMPGMNGFEVLERAGATHLPLVIFVTAYDEYALRAFDIHALDYLLKPFTTARFRDAMRRARSEIQRRADGTYQNVAHILDHHREQSGETNGRYLFRFAVRERDRFLLLKASEVEWIDSAGNYARLHARGASFLVRMTMSELERKLDPRHFARTHRTTIVNLDRVREIAPGSHGDFDVVLNNGQTVKLSRNYRDRLLSR
jgi:two-component system LytT family response regulator